MPQFVKETQTAKFRSYERNAYQYENSNSLRDLYDAIIDAKETRQPNAAFVTIHIGEKKIKTSDIEKTINLNSDSKDNRDNNRPIKIRNLTFNIDDFISFKKFEGEYEKIKKGEWSGSDGIDLENTQPIYTNFQLSQVEIAAKGKKSDKMIYEVEGIEETKTKKGKKEIGNGDCGKVCLTTIMTRLGLDLKILKDVKPQELVNVDCMISFIIFHNLPISIIANSFVTLKNVYEMIASEETCEISIKDKKKNIKNYVCIRPKLGRDVEEVFFYKSENEKAIILIDEINQHYDIVKNLKICDDVFISVSSKVIKGDVILFSPRQVNINSKKQKEVFKRFVIFDYETVIDFDKDSCMQEYSLSILNLSDTELEELTDADMAGDVERVNNIRKNCCVTFLGFDCSIQFIEWIQNNQNDTVFTFIGFNNTNFDNFILLSALLNYDNIEYELDVNNIFYNGSQLLNFLLSGRHETFDIRKHLLGSLKDNCKSFKINCCAKKSFDHNVPQQKYLEGTLIDYITDNEELKEYNEFDVLATAVLFCKYRRALSEIDVTRKFAKGLDKIKTIGSLIYKVFEEKKKDQRYNLPKLDYKQYTDLQKFKIAGRVELFNGVQKVEVRLVSTDVCSLYPYVMAVAPVFYPCGEIVETEQFMGYDKIGFYYCDIDQSNLRENNLPNIYAKKSVGINDWDTTEVLEDYLISSVTIELLLKFGCKVVIKNGFYFTDKKRSCDMFDFLLDCMSAKNKQDGLKAVVSSDYNPALRETLKLLMNSLSGKVIEGLHTEKTTDVNSIAEYLELEKSAKKINFINAIGNKMFVTYEMEEEKLLAKQRPIYLGVLIYDYAKRYMFENSYSKVGLDQLLYTDTDASKFRYSRFLEWKKEIDEKNIIVPHWVDVETIDPRYKTHKIYESGSKVFGSFEDELEDAVGEKYTFYCVEKKSWCYTVDGKSKFRFKGLNGSAINIDLTERFINEVIIKHKASEKRSAWEETKYKIEDGSEIEVYQYAVNNKAKSIEEDGADKFFEKLYTEGDAYVLCSSFRKIVKNSRRDVGIDDTEKYNDLINKVQVNYFLKHINIKNQG